MKPTTMQCTPPTPHPRGGCGRRHGGTGGRRGRRGGHLGRARQRRRGRVPVADGSPRAPGGSAARWRRRSTLQTGSLFFWCGEGQPQTDVFGLCERKKRKVWGRPKKKELGLDDFPQQIAVACNSLPSAPRCSKNRIDLVSPSGEATSLGLEVLT